MIEERKAAGLLCRRYPDGIIEFVADDLNPSTVDAWVNTMREEVLNNPNGTITYWVHNASHMRSLNITAYFRQAIGQLISELTAKVPLSSGYTALLVPRTIFMQLVRIYVNSLPFRPHDVRMIFFDEEQAFEWLRAQRKALEEKHKLETK